MLESTAELDAESLRKLALRLFSEQELKANPISCILRTIDLVDRVIGTTVPIQGLGSEIPAQNLLISRLQETAQARGLNPEALAKELEVSLAALRNWQHGVEPSPTNRAKIEKFLDSQTRVVGPGQPEKIGVPPVGELFGRSQPQPEPESPATHG